MVILEPTFTIRGKKRVRVCIFLWFQRAKVGSNRQDRNLNQTKGKYLYLNFCFLKKAINYLSIYWEKEQFLVKKKKRKRQKKKRGLRGFLLLFLFLFLFGHKMNMVQAGID